MLRKISRFYKSKQVNAFFDKNTVNIEMSVILLISTILIFFAAVLGGIFFSALSKLGIWSFF